MWLERQGNHDHVEVLRDRLGSNKGRAVLFLGAGLSFGASRLGRKSLSDEDKWDTKYIGGEEDKVMEVIINDDGQPFPTWSRLKSRMRKRLALAYEQDQDSLNSFFRSSDPLDCAQLFRNLV